MKKIMRLKRVNRPNEIVLLDTESGGFSLSPSTETSITNGNYMSVEGQEFAVFASASNLYFQWNARRWNFHGFESKVRYEHDLQRQTTSFSVDDETIRYPAWWAGDSTFNPNLPERDEDEDFLAYVANLAKNEELQKILIQSWGG